LREVGPTSTRPVTSQKTGKIFQIKVLLNLDLHFRYLSFSEGTFEQFIQANTGASKEKRVTKNVILIIEDKITDNY